MSSGEREHTSCDDVLAEVWLFLDNECDRERRAILQRHLDDCGSCLEHYGLEEHIKALLHRKCSGEHAPKELRDRLRASIRETVLRQAEVTVEYGPDGTSVEVRTRKTSSAE
ncbi:mycothiol system anti-sigma-R factor [Saccharopolyspora erythraea NRRL 2338]|uniref:Possible anti-sigma factor n=2 Tax=Saccharopolyspora erythraea TaxID=1836 RepID=A4FNH4_SACEN|nr:mycothiol system anti-sigma-R factor [Saccharopolyspora erythraea]EQD82135.1 anti-sigma factor [Saccharopolyspora erythraea D]PFG99237.1 mycothiol system anti-sigma-R factor [Saccharopolyspora erythraea NRRL 2338]QRK89182.1 mycothiol system anti-sigma-R factor [Saccharopolyspora erythraea]CAM05599.1 possible anti-sigma factor [Saccharopolyspora erythraea NRRL 2338]